MSKRKESISNSIVNRKGDIDSKAKGLVSKENATVSIKAMKNNNPNWNEQSLSNFMKYDTTVVMSEKWTNFDDPFTQLYTTSIISGSKPDRNIEEIHFIQVSLFKGLRKVLEKSEIPNNNNKKVDEDKPSNSNKNKTNLMEICDEEIIL